MQNVAYYERWSLRFRPAGSERGFVDSRAGQLSRAASVCRLGMVTLFGAILVTHIIVGSKHPAGLAVTGVEVAVNAALFCLERSRLYRRALGNTGMEIHFAVSTWMLPFRVFFTQDHPLSVVFEAMDWPVDLEPFTMYMYGGGLISLFSTSACCLLLPIRWCLLLPMQFLSVVCIALFQMALPEQYRNLTQSAIQVFAFLIVQVLLSYGKWMTERIERELFFRMTFEKTLRCAAERDKEIAEQAGTNSTDDAPEPRFGRVASLLSGNSERASSLPTTTDTGKIFAEVQRSVRAEEKSPVDEVIGQASDRSAGAGVSLQQLGNLGHDEHWVIGLEELSAPTAPSAGLLGSGSYGLVMSACYHGAPVALKGAKFTDDGVSWARGLASMAQELRILRHLRHPNIALLYGACVEPVSMELLLVLEHVDGTPLHTLAASGYHFVDARTRCKLSHDITCALVYLHSRAPPIVHGDIKSSNVLVEHIVAEGSQLRAKLVDFGLSRMLASRSGRLGGTACWAAPEVLRGAGTPHPSADVFSMGKLLYMIITGRHPSPDPPSHLDSDGVGAAAAMCWELPLAEGVPTPRECRRLCSACLQRDPSCRPTMREVQRTVAEWWRGGAAASLGGSASGMPRLGGVAEALKAARDYQALLRERRRQRQKRQQEEEEDSALAAPPPRRLTL